MQHTSRQGADPQSNELLRKRGYRLTPQRHMILTVIQEAEHHLSIDQITEQVQRKNPQVSVSTIYRTLELLKNLDLIHESHLPGGQPTYETIAGHTHHHLICRNCHKTIHLDEDLLGTLREQLQSQYGYHQLNLELNASGYCEDCWRNVLHRE